MSHTEVQAEHNFRDLLAKAIDSADFKRGSAQADDEWAERNEEYRDAEAPAVTCRPFWLDPEICSVSRLKPHYVDRFLEFAHAKTFGYGEVGAMISLGNLAQVENCIASLYISLEAFDGLLVCNDCLRPAFVFPTNDKRFVRDCPCHSENIELFEWLPLLRAIPNRFVVEAFGAETADELRSQHWGNLLKAANRCTYVHKPSLGAMQEVESANPKELQDAMQVLQEEVRTERGREALDIVNAYLPDSLLDVTQAAKFLNRSEVRISQLAKKGLIGFRKAGRYLFSRRQLQIFKLIKRPAGKPGHKNPKSNT